MLSNTFWVWPEVGTGILLAVPPAGEKYPQMQWMDLGMQWDTWRQLRTLKYLKCLIVWYITWWRVQQTQLILHCYIFCNCFCHPPGTVLTWLTFWSSSETDTSFFLSGLSLQYIIMAALRTASSNFPSFDNLRMSASFSGVTPFFWIQQRWRSLAADILPCLAALISQLTARRLLRSGSLSSASIKKCWPNWKVKGERELLLLKRFYSFLLHHRISISTLYTYERLCKGRTFMVNCFVPMLPMSEPHKEMNSKPKILQSHCCVSFCLG